MRDIKAEPAETNKSDVGSLAAAIQTIARSRGSTPELIRPALEAAAQRRKCSLLDVVEFLLPEAERDVALDRERAQAEQLEQPAGDQHAARALVEVEAAITNSQDDSSRRSLLALIIARWALRSVGHPRGASEQALSEALHALRGVGGVLADAMDAADGAALDIESDKRENVAYGLPARDEEFIDGVVERTRRELAADRLRDRALVERIIDARQPPTPETSDDA